MLLNISGNYFFPPFGAAVAHVVEWVIETHLLPTCHVGMGKKLNPRLIPSHWEMHKSVPLELLVPKPGWMGRVVKKKKPILSNRWIIRSLLAGFANEMKTDDSLWPPLRRAVYPTSVFEYFYEPQRVGMHMFSFTLQPLFFCPRCDTDQTQSCSHCYFVIDAQNHIRCPVLCCHVYLSIRCLLHSKYGSLFSFFK